MYRHSRYSRVVWGQDHVLIHCNYCSLLPRAKYFVVFGSSQQNLFMYVLLPIAPLHFLSSFFVTGSYSCGRTASESAASYMYVVHLSCCFFGYSKDLEVNCSGFVLVHLRSGFLTCSNCCTWVRISITVHIQLVRTKTENQIKNQN